MTTAKLTIGTKGFVLYGKLKECGVPFPNTTQEDKMRHNQFDVEVRNMEERQPVSRTFNWYDSHANFSKGKVSMTKEDLKYAFKAFIEDAISGTMKFEDFCSEYGYDEDSRRAEKIYNMCKYHLINVTQLGINESELYNMINQLSEMGIE